MKNYLPNYLSMLVLMFVCIVSCSNETTSDPGFEIGGTPAETVYQIPSDRKVRLPGTGFQAGDVVRLTDTGISHPETRSASAKSSPAGTSASATPRTSTASNTEPS